MALLPQELTRSDERRRVLEFPTDDVTPLVQSQRQVSVRVNPIRVVRVHDRLGRRSNRDRDFEIGGSASRDPRDLRREVFDVILLSLESALGDKHREIAVFDAELLDPVSYTHLTLPTILLV